jgi:uncharacterized protein YsxB (DUF464 family)
MTTIRFYRDRDRLSGFTCQGHSGYAQAGEDIVCAAITSALRLTECTINDVLHANAEVAISQQGARISLSLPSGSPVDAGCQATLQGFALYMRELQNEYPEHLTVLEV